MDGWITIGTELDTKKFDVQIQQLERKVNELEKELSNPKAVELMEPGELEKIQLELEKTKNKLVSLRRQKQKLEETKGMQGLTEGINNLGNSFQKSVSKAGRLALAIFGIRSAYNLLKSASSELATYDQQYAANLEYIRFVLTQAIAPVLRGIVQLAMQLLAYINAIVQGWFGINLFSSGSVENFKKMKAQAGGVSKAVKEIKKQLAGFDEANILTDKSDSGTLAGAGGVGMPSMDLSAIQGEQPAWLQWIVKNKDTILAVLFGIATALSAIKLGIDPLQSLGIGLILLGVYLTVKGIMDYLKDPTWENFGKTLLGIGIIVAGIGLVIGAWPVVLAGVAIAIWAIVIKYWDKIRGKLDEASEWLHGKSDWVRDMFGDTIGNIYDSLVSIFDSAKEHANNFFTNIKTIFDGIIKFIKGVFTGDWKQAWDGLKQIIIGYFEIVKSRIEFIFSGIVNAIKLKIDRIKTFFSDLVQTVFNLFGWIGSVLPEEIANKFKAVMNKVIGAVESILNKPIQALNGLISTLNNIPGVNVSQIREIHFQRLATGGIINMPNRGTMLGSMAIGGESGAEGVIPLTDAQAMAELGEAIGRNVIINANIINKMNTRTISREMVRVHNEQNFARNS